MALYSGFNNDYVDGHRSANYDSRCLQFAANRTAYLSEGRVKILHKLGVAYSLDEQDAYRGTHGIRSPETDVEIFTASAGAEIGYTFLMDGISATDPISAHGGARTLLDGLVAEAMS